MKKKETWAEEGTPLQMQKKTKTKHQFVKTKQKVDEGKHFPPHTNYDT
jgi:hypothetical protein